MRPALPSFLVLLLLAGCRSGSAETSEVSVTSAASTAAPSATAPAAPKVAAPAPPPQPKDPEVEPTPMAAGKPTKLDDVGLRIAPAFGYTLKDRGTHWNLEGTGSGAPLVWVMRKMYSASAPLGAPVPCADPKEGAPHAEPDGSFTYRCTGSASGDGTWFARLVPTTNATYPTVQCQGSSKSPEKLELIEATCRSIKKG